MEEKVTNIFFEIFKKYDNIEKFNLSEIKKEVKKELLEDETFVNYFYNIVKQIRKETNKNIEINNFLEFFLTTITKNYYYKYLKEKKKEKDLRIFILLYFRHKFKIKNEQDINNLKKYLEKRIKVKIYSIIRNNLIKYSNQKQRKEKYNQKIFDYKKNLITTDNNLIKEVEEFFFENKDIFFQKYPNIDFLLKEIDKRKENFLKKNNFLKNNYIFEKQLNNCIYEFIDYLLEKKNDFILHNN